MFEFARVSAMKWSSFENYQETNSQLVNMPTEVSIQKKKKSREGAGVIFAAVVCSKSYNSFEKNHLSTLIFYPENYETQKKRKTRE